MRFTTIMLSLGLAAVAIVALGVGPTSAQSTSGTSPFLASTSIGDSVIGNGAPGPFMLVKKGHGFWSSWFPQRLLDRRISRVQVLGQLPPGV